MLRLGLVDDGSQIKAAQQGLVWRDAVRLQLVLISVLAAAGLRVPAVSAQISDDVVRIGVLNDQSGLYADLGGPGSVVAARMAVEDAGGTVLGKPVVIIVADHQNKADIRYRGSGRAPMVRDRRRGHGDRI
jgi:ABC-type branched-subunit amino acid transport system substrate-binding protein